MKTTIVKTFSIFAPQFSQYMVSISNISYFIGGRALFENASAFIRPDDKIGLIGLNGRGKSTLLKLINGELTLDAGSISKGKECTIGFLNQDLLSFQSDDAILTVAMAAFKDAVDTQRQIETVLHQLDTEYSEALVEKLTKLQEKFEHLDGYTMQAKAEEVLEGIGFTTSDLHRPLKEFSGGWRMRVILAKLLLEKPSLLMLDEPTNHLDLPSIEWVENYLRDYPGAVIVVSHDRRFIDAVATKTIEVTQQQLVTYEGNYSFYLEQKEQREEIQQNAFENQQQKLRQAERFIDRFRYKASKSRQVQSRIKQLDKMEKIEEVVDDNAYVNFKFTFKQQSGRHIINLHDVSKSYGDVHILSHANAAIERGDKIALIGANGKGKSTLLRIIAGTEPIEGERKEGYNVIMGFFAQHQLESLNIENEILDELKMEGTGKTEMELRNLLGCFLFSDDDAFKKIKVLSGGEKSRVALAKTLISEANFLLLDEPTNHLDFLSENILIQALQQYQGTFVVVSHNRHFVNQIANKIWYIEGQQIKEYPGTYEEYEFWKQNQAQPQADQKPMQAIKPKPSKANKPEASSDQRQKLNKQLSAHEAKINQLQKRLDELEIVLSDPTLYSNAAKLSQLQKEHEAIQSQMAQANADWEIVAGEIDKLSVSSQP
jgi:ATP-binding cassette, subfamily F, member 3